MNSITALRIDRDRDLTADIVPETYLKCPVFRELDFPWATHAAEKQFTEVRAVWSDKFLYVHLWAKDSWITATQTKAKGPVWKDDCLEVFLQPEPDRYYGWEVNALGTLLEYRTSGWGAGPVEDRHFDYAWKSAAQWKARKHDAGWVLEIRIPFSKDLGKVPQKGDQWRATFNRIDVDRQARVSYSTFSDLGPEKVWFHQPDGFGQIVFS